MTGEPDAHGLFGHLKYAGYIIDELAVLTAPVKLIEVLLDLGDGHKDCGAQHIGLYLHVVFRFLRQQRCTFSRSCIQSLVKYPVGQFIGAGKAQTACAGILLTERCINKDGSSVDREEDILMILYVIHRFRHSVKNGFAQDIAILPEILVRQKHTVGLDDLLNGNGGRGAIVQFGIIWAVRIKKFSLLGDNCMMRKCHIVVFLLYWLNSGEKSISPIKL